MKVIAPNILSIIDGPEENEEALWNNATSYKSGNKIIHKHYIYMAITDSTGIDPETNALLGSSAKWRLMGPTNRYACIDIYNYTQTIATETGKPLTLKLPYAAPSTAVALLNMRAIRADISVSTTYGENLFSQQYDLLEDSLHEWDYWFGPFRFKSDIVATRIAPLSGELSITLHHPEKAAIGLIVVGQEHEIGLTQFGARAGFVNYSIFEADTFGSVTFVKRNNARRASFPVYLHPREANYVHKVVSQFNGSPALWVGDNETDREPLTVWGKLKEFDDEYSDVNRNNVSFDVEGII